MVHTGKRKSDFPIDADTGFGPMLPLACGCAALHPQPALRPPLGLSEVVMPGGMSTYHPWPPGVPGRPSPAGSRGGRAGGRCGPHPWSMGRLRAARTSPRLMMLLGCVIGYSAPLLLCGPRLNGLPLCHGATTWCHSVPGLGRGLVPPGGATSPCPPSNPLISLVPFPPGSNSPARGTAAPGPGAIRWCHTPL
jgi:hypothetical protein